MERQECQLNSHTHTHTSGLIIYGSSEMSTEIILDLCYIEPPVWLAWSTAVQVTWPGPELGFVSGWNWKNSWPGWPSQPSLNWVPRRGLWESEGSQVKIWVLAPNAQGTERDLCCSGSFLVGVRVASISLTQREEWICSPPKTPVNGTIQLC